MLYIQVEDAKVINHIDALQVRFPDPERQFRDRRHLHHVQQPFRMRLQRCGIEEEICDMRNIQAVRYHVLEDAPPFDGTKREYPAPVSGASDIEGYTSTIIATGGHGRDCNNGYVPKTVRNWRGAVIDASIPSILRQGGFYR